MIGKLLAQIYLSLYLICVVACNIIAGIALFMFLPYILSFIITGHWDA